MNKWIYSFGSNTEGNASMKELLGGKGAGLAEMCNIGIAVPPGFTITTEVCTYYYQHERQLPGDLEEQLNRALANIEDKLQAKFGDKNNPLLVSVRSGARASMPGMMDTILNLGLNDQTVEGLAEKTGNKRFAYDSYRRFIQMYANVVLDVSHSYFEEIISHRKFVHNIKQDSDLTIEDLLRIISEFKQKILDETGRPFPEDTKEQLWAAVKAVFNSWMNNRAITYRKLNDIPEEWGTAVNIQSMVFGNMGQDCGTGVAFTRNPSTGEKVLYGEYLVNAQGEDVVAGIRTPMPIKHMQESMPDVFNEFVNISQKLEKHYSDMQDIEFTVQNNRLWILQTRNGKRSAQAAIKIAVDMVQEGLISQEDAVRRVNPESLDQILHPTIDPNAKCNIIAQGLPASPGVASGMVVFSASDAEKYLSEHKKTILVRIETSPEDISGMNAACGILTARGGMTSHAAVVARGMGKSCVCGASNVNIDYKNATLSVNGYVVKEGEVITINGSTGEIILGEIPTIQPNLSSEFMQLMQWVDEIRAMGVRANAETAHDIKMAFKFGADGIGLCRTEHMFFDDDRIIVMREMIVSESVEGRKKSLEKLLPMQRNDFISILELAQSKTVNIRLLDPPLHEFLPHTEKEIKEVAKASGLSIEVIEENAYKLKEMNPMLGHRGCRLGISYPEIYEMQARAIFEAMIEVMTKDGIKPVVEIMVPLVISGKELSILKDLIVKEANRLETAHKIKLNYQVGTMIELPRAALMAHEIAEHAEFFSFGTNDLTQTTLGISRDDSGSFLHTYKEKNILSEDPFVRLDESGVGELMKIAVERGRSTKNDLKIGICGEHGGNPKTMKFVQDLGLEYVSCSPYRIPIARLAAAQIKISEG
ncbi:Pyruvate, phosphate dikinase [Rickettsiales bacterium Ac37b]|nr:Pyruvate, phosphate dikinase [Rickettsiales bacterium Ac37b]